MSARVEQIVEIVETINKKKENRLKGKRKVNHINTKTTKDTEKITEITTSELRGIADKITRMVQRNRSIPIEKIREKLNVEVGSIIANGVRESYLLGLHFIEAFAERTVQLTPEQVTLMNSQIKSEIERFWGQVENIIQKENEKRIAGAAAPLDLSLFDTFNKSFARSALTMNFLALNDATLTTRQTVFREQIDDFGITVEGSIQIPQMIFVTRKDDRVDPQCLNLEGRTFPIDNIPASDKPPVHFGCRCRLLPVERGKVFNA